MTTNVTCTSECMFRTIGRSPKNMTISAGLRWEPFIGGKMPLGYVLHFDMGAFLSNTHSTVYPNAPAGVLYPGRFAIRYQRPAVAYSPQRFCSAHRLGVGSQGRRPDDHPRILWPVLRTAPHAVRLRLLASSAMGIDHFPYQRRFRESMGGSRRAAIRSRCSSDKNFQFPQPGNYTSYPLDPKITYLQQWNLSIQKQIGANWLASASYLGNNTVHLWADAPINAAVYLPQATCVIAGVTYTPCSSTANTNQRRVLNLLNPDQGKYYGVIHYLDDGSTANYNALLLSLQHRLSNHFTVLGNYTWSHCIAGIFTSELDGTQYTNPQNRNQDRGNCATIDRRSHLQRLRSGGSSEVRQQGDPAAGRQLEAVADFESPVRQLLHCRVGTRPGLERHHRSRAARELLWTDALRTGGQTKNIWLNTAPGVFAQPALGTFGNEGQSAFLDRERSSST